MEKDWNNLLSDTYKFFEDIYFDCQSGWYELLNELGKELQNSNEPLDLTQVKQKFGGLRVYGIYTLTASDIIDKAILKSFETCERCGKPGKLIKASKLRVRCEECV